MIFCEQNLICATLKLRPNSPPRSRGLQFICLERKTLLDGVAKWIVTVYLTSIKQVTAIGDFCPRRNTIPTRTVILGRGVSSLSLSTGMLTNSFHINRCWSVNFDH